MTRFITKEKAQSPHSPWQKWCITQHAICPYAPKPLHLRLKPLLAIGQKINQVLNGLLTVDRVRQRLDHARVNEGVPVDGAHGDNILEDKVGGIGDDVDLVTGGETQNVDNDLARAGGMAPAWVNGLELSKKRARWSESEGF